jgi:threonine/homoserine/homoserine lactone efflux protein
LESIWFYLSLGLVLGFASAVSPGPLITLLAAETLRHGPKAGLLISVVPVITDLPIIVLSLLVVSRFAGLQQAMGVLALCGAGFLVYLAYENLTTRESRGAVPMQPLDAGPLRKGLGVNILNPHAYLFWFIVGAPLVLTAWRQGLWPTVAFFLSFYVLLIGCNLVFVLILSTTRRYIQGPAYLWTLRLLGLCLLVFAALFVKKGLQDLGWK